MRLNLLLLIFLPFLSAFVLAVAGRFMPRRLAEAIACLSVAGSFVAAAVGFFSRSGAQTFALFNWIQVGNFSAPMTVVYDPLSAVMALMVTFVSTLIHIYSVAFMREDEDYVRYFCYLNLFVFAMLVVTLADNLLFLYLGWEGVGFCSYALIGFWYADAVNAAAGRKAFIVTRIGDVAFGVAIALFFVAGQDLSISSINARTGSLNAGLATAVGFLLLWAAVGKSAQLPLAVWLPDAMAGPTPVSALIHAATMVTAGVYLLMRFFPVLALSPEVLAVVALVGAVTALFGACAALAQRDIKRVLAYSTISQVSFMFLGVGAGDVTGSLFQLLSHAFYKALLFLAAGCIIQALHEEHDIFRMGNLRQSLPAIFPLFLAGALSLAAVPPFGGYFSKDHILAAAYSHPDPVYRVFWVLGMITSFLTPLYTFRLFFLLFLHKPVQTDGRHNLPVPRVMVWVLWPLAILSLAAGALNFPALFFGSEWLAGYLAPIKGGGLFIPPSPGVESMTLGLSGVLSILALVSAYFLYRPVAFRPAAPRRERLGEVFLSGFYLDLLYARAIAGPYRSISRFLWKDVDEGAWDSGIVEMIRTLPALSTYFQMWTTGRLSYYLKMLFLGFTAILGAIVLGWYRW